MPPGVSGPSIDGTAGGGVQRPRLLNLSSWTATTMTMRRLPLLIATGLFALGATAALAGGSSAPFQQYEPDPALKTATKANLEGRVRHACTVVQARMTSATEASLERPCGCYARQTLRSLDAVRDRGLPDDRLLQRFRPREGALGPGQLQAAAAGLMTHPGSAAPGDNKDYRRFFGSSAKG